MKPDPIAAVVRASSPPVLLVTAADEQHPFDDYLAEVLLTEGYACFAWWGLSPEGWRQPTRRGLTPGGDGDGVSPLQTGSAGLPGTDPDSRTDPAPSLLILGAGAAAQTPVEEVEAYLRRGGKMIVMRPPDSWAPLLGLAVPGELYRTAPDAYLHVNTDHPWLQGFPEGDLQCPGESRVFRAEGAEPLAFIAGQLGMPSIFPAVSHHRVGEGEVVTFTYDLPETLVLFQQGRAENSSTGRNPDANRDGKFCADDAMTAMRDYRLRFVPQADVHRDLLVRVIRGLLGDTLPLPRLWHFPDAAPAVLFVDGDGDSMIWDDLEVTVAMAAEQGYPYTLYMMRAEIEAFDREAVLALRDRGFAFGVHPWCGPRPTIEQWETEIGEIVAVFTEKFGFAPTSLRSHSCIFPGWDEHPDIIRRHGLRLDTNLAPGYRYRDGYPNGSGLPLRFVDRAGQIVDCWEQSTIQTEDGALTPKVLLPPLTREEALVLARSMLQRAAATYHNVFHPYFHPINLGERGARVAAWFRGVLREARDLGLPGVNASEWLAFNDARMGVRCEDVRWDAAGRELSFTVSSPAPLDGATILLPPCGGLIPVQAMVGGNEAELEPVDLERSDWTALVLDLPPQGRLSVSIRYEA
ncbi:hypothetical protein LLH23_03765 [bacterium]|nr:hypothetical protein [bacterium]